MTTPDDQSLPTTPAQRPALQRSVDADVHPTAVDLAASGDPAIDTTIHDLHVHAGHATSDVLREAKADKLVTLELAVPKSFRKKLRAEAERRGMSVDKLVLTLLRHQVGD